MMRKMANRLLLVMLTGAGIFIGYLFIHLRQPLPTFPNPTIIGTAAPDDNDIRYKLRTKLSTSDKQHLFDGGCRIVTNTDEFPLPIKNVFATITREKPFAMANPGARFNATDVIEAGLPRRRLNFAASCQNRWLILYEHGGIGLRLQVMALAIESKDQVRFLWGGEGFRPIANLTALQDAILSGKIKDANRF